MGSKEIKKIYSYKRELISVFLILTMYPIGLYYMFKAKPFTPKIRKMIFLVVVLYFVFTVVKLNIQGKMMYM